MTTRLIFPILNKNASIFTGPLLYLSDKVSIETMSSEDIGLITTHPSDEYKSLLPKNAKVINIRDVDATDIDNIVRANSTILCFILNYMKDEHPISLSFAAQISKKTKSKVDKIIEMPVSADTHTQRKNVYKLKKTNKGSDLADFYKVVMTVYEKHQHILLTLDRFNSALWRKLENDKIVDITIALESLIDGNSELQYKFSLYNSFASEADVTKRGDVSKTLKQLYNARSAIVHGSAMTKNEHDKKIKPIIDNWNEIVKIAEKAIGYHLLYLYGHDISSWYSHQENMAIGSEARIFKS